MEERRAMNARQWLSNCPAASCLLLGAPLVQTSRSSHGKGLGLFVTRPVQAFTPILRDPHMILMQPNEDLPELFHRFLNLSEAHRGEFLSLSYPHDPERDSRLEAKLRRRGMGSNQNGEFYSQMIRVANVMQTNAFNVDFKLGQEAQHRALFPRIARINHSCAPNAHVCFYPPFDRASSTGHMVAYALRSMQPGDEVLISYFNILHPRFLRQERARKWGFDCSCPVCLLDPSKPNQAELQREQLVQTMADLAGVRGSSNPSIERVNAAVEDGLALAEQIRHRSPLCPALPDLYDGLAMVQAKARTMQLDDDQQARLLFLLEQSVLWEARITGPDSPPTTERLFKLKEFAKRKASRSIPIVDCPEPGRYNILWNDR